MLIVLFIDSILEVIESNAGSDSPQYYTTLEAKNDLLTKEKRWKELEGNLATAYEYYKARTGNSILTYSYLARLISTKQQLEYTEQVLHLLPQARIMCEELYGQESENFLTLLQDTAFMYSEYKMYDESINCYNKLLELKSNYGKNSDIFDILNNIASAYYLKGEVNIARERYDELFSKVELTKDANVPAKLNYWANYAKLEHESGNIVNAEKLYKQSFSKSIELYTHANEKSLTHLYNLQRFLITTNQLINAEGLLKDYYEKLHNDYPETDEFHYEILDMLTNLYIRAKNYESLESNLIKKYELGIRLYGDDSIQNFGTLVNLASTYNVTYKDESAVETLNKIAKTIKPETALKANKNYYDTYYKIIECYNEKEKTDGSSDDIIMDTIKDNKKKADEAINQNDFITAVIYMKNNLELYIKYRGDNHPETILCKRDLAETMMSAGNYEEALNLLLNVVGVFKSELGETHHEYQRTIYTIAKCYYNMQHYEDALKTFKEVFYQVESVLESDHPFLYDVKRHIAETLFYMFKNSDEAIQLYNELHKVNRQKENPDEIEEAHFTIRLGELYLRNKEYEKSLEYLNRAESLYEKLYQGNPNPYTILICELKAFIMWQLKDLDSAEKYYLAALSSAKQIMPYGHPSQIKILKTLTKFYFDENRFGEALPINCELLEIYLSQYPEKNAVIIEQKLVIALVMNNLQDHEKVVEILNNVLQYTDVEISDYAKRIFNNLYSTYKSE